MNMRWIVSFTLLIMVIGMCAGLTLAGLNPWESPARARAMDVQTEYQSEINNQELKKKSAQTEALIREIKRKQDMADWRAQEERNFTQQFNQAKLRAYSSMIESVSIVVKSLGIAVAAVGSILILMRAFMAMQSATKKDPWTSPEYRRWRREQARQNELYHNRRNGHEQQAVPIIEALFKDISSK